ncbi:LPXTG cell wall anchor domain-containing protein [Psychromarinibacter sp. C21-152]|uniref:LPXTG cell wall anchor domain-containing protein n=1 Tax=Psychromarinibacter sediminicola TaxID=3033385 RepID=A0AAE3NQ33_9RHOB|nr:LPXTG cell wall anchor domain-containing protein [Psychromarinibacter sediminicola]
MSLILGGSPASRLRPREIPPPPAPRKAGLARRRHPRYPTGRKTGESGMDWLIWIGAAVSLVGLAGLVWCIVLVWKARRAQLPDAELRERVRRVIPLNMGALLLSVFGLILVIVGIVLG